MLSRWGKPAEIFVLVFFMMAQFFIWPISISLVQIDHLINHNHLFKRSVILIKAWCYYESRILGAHHGLISTYALETLVLYIFHVFNNCFAGPLEVTDEFRVNCVFSLFLISFYLDYYIFLICNLLYIFLLGRFYIVFWSSSVILIGIISVLVFGALFVLVHFQIWQVILFCYFSLSVENITSVSWWPDANILCSRASTKWQWTIIAEQDLPWCVQLCICCFTSRKSESTLCFEAF